MTANTNGFSEPSPNDLILLTGATSYVGGPILLELLSKGYHVRGTVRNGDKADKLRKKHSKFADLLDVVIVEDIAVSGAFDKAVVGCTGVIHVASAASLAITDFDRDLLAPAIEGTTYLLRSVMDHGPTVKRVVITSSAAAIIDVSKGLRPGYTYTEKDWNPATREEALQQPSDFIFGYCASKSIAEKAAWDLVEGKTGEKPAFTLSTICAARMYGPNQQPVDTIDGLNLSSQAFYSHMNGSLKEPLPVDFPVWCDVRDVGIAHVKALEHPTGGRFILSTGHYQYSDICKILREEMPELGDRVPDPSGTPYPETYSMDGSKAIEELGLELRSFKTMVLDMARDLLALEKRSK